MPSQFVPVVSIGRNGTLSIDSEYGHGTKEIVAQPDGSILFLTSTTVQRWLADGQPDFGFNGASYAPLPRGEDGYPDYYGPTVLADGKILVSGVNSSGLVSSQLLLRLNTDGSIDTSFGIAGKASNKVDPTNRMYIVDTKVLADGKILVVSNDWAIASDGSSGQDEPMRIGLTRYLANGELDTSFGANGFKLDAADFYGDCAIVQADGKIVVSGQLRANSQPAVMRFNADGSRDNTFSDDGLALPMGQYGRASATTLQPDGKILVVGGSYNGMVISRLNADGSIDTTFADDGILRLDTIMGFGEYVHVNDDGTILVGGGMQSFMQGQKPVVLRLHSDGTLDTTYGVNGFGLVDLPKDQTQYMTGTTIDADGRLLWYGYSYGNKGGSLTPLLVAFDANGHPDTGFGNAAAGTSNSASYTQGYINQFLNPHVHIGNQDQLNYDGLTVTLERAGGAKAADHFTAGNGVSFEQGAALVKGMKIGTVTESAGSLKLVFNTAATPALADLALQSIGYSNSGSVTNGQHVTINWNFSTSVGSTQTSTDVTLHTTDAPYWIDQLLDRSTVSQSAAALRAELVNMLAGSRTLNLQFAADNGAAAFSDADQATIRTALAKLADVLDLQLGSSGTKVVVHHSAEVASGEGVAYDISGGRGDVYLASAPTLENVLHSLEHMLGLQHAGTSSADQFDAVDIAALQFLYGTSKTARAGDDTYQLSANNSNFIWDGAGKDTISAAGLSSGVTLHLEAGHWDYIGAQGSSITAAGQVTINYGSTIENATGGNGNDQLTGSSSDNVLAGGTGNDVLTGLGGNDTLDGGAGIDMAIYSGKAASYVVSRTATGWSVKDRGGSEGTDQLVGIERLQFNDKFLALGDDAAQVYRLYQAAFNRTPDAGGLGYWLHAQEGGASLRSIAADFINGAEFKQLYNGANEEAFVTQLYQNVLHRAPDAAGLAYWADHLKTDATRLDVLLGFSESTENIAALTGITDTGMAYTPFH
jgi:uncharacterized delta-60 repeat protein